MENYFKATHKVRSYELDSFGHVNNAVYLNYLEYARMEYLLQKGLSFTDFTKWDRIPYVTKAEIQYKSSARVHDLLEIRGTINQWKKVSFVIHYEILNKTTQKIAAVADLKFVFVNKSEKMMPIPDEFKKAFIGFSS